MDGATAAARVVRPIDVALLAAAARTAASAIGDAAEPARSIEAAVDSFYDAVAGVMPSVFVLEHGRLWLVAQRGYAVVPDGITVEHGITGRSIRLGRPQFAPDVHRGSGLRCGAPGRPLRACGSAAERRHDRRRPQCRSRASAARTARPRRSDRSPVRSRRRRRAPSEPDARSRGAGTSVRAPRQPSRSAGHRSARRRIAPEGAAGADEPARRLGRARRRSRARRLARRRGVAAAALRAAARSGTHTDRSERGLPRPRPRRRRAASAARSPSSGCRCARTPETSARSSASLERKRAWTRASSTRRRSSLRMSRPHSTRRSPSSASVSAQRRIR